LNHKTILELTRSMLHNLETIEKVFIEKNNKKAKARNAKAGTAPQKGLSVPHKRGNGGSLGGPAPKKTHTAKYCKWCQAAGGPFKTHDTSKCCRFDKDGKEKGHSYKPFATKKPWKKGGGDSGQMAYLTKKLEQLEKKLKKSKSKKSSKKCARDLSSNSLDSD
jgi:hypothetical protein